MKTLICSIFVVYHGYGNGRLLRCAGTAMRKKPAFGVPASECFLISAFL